MALETAFDLLRSARLALLSDDYETRVNAYYAVEDATAELTAILASTDIRTI
jgi:hypothetical protein